MRSKHTNKHHIVPSSRQGANGEQNIAVVDEKKHILFHKLFLNKIPTEQIQLIMDINRKVHTKEFRFRMHELLTRSPDEIYIEEAFKSHEAMMRIFYNKHGF